MRRGEGKEEEKDRCRAALHKIIQGSRLLRVGPLPVVVLRCFASIKGDFGYVVVECLSWSLACPGIHLMPSSPTSDAFHDAADYAMDSEAKGERVVAKLQEAKAENEVCDDDCQMSSMSIDVHDNTMSPEKRQKSVGDPNKCRRRGRSPINRKQSMIEKIIKKMSQMSGPHGGMWIYDLNETPIDLEN
ncbi:hypothetical protein RHMOL_Rhmol08G0253000 [Rhododendron molle]|uniref:Uncharacterized protein n=1 Tax=Rhododendron molle TaxID=49168 RepID=A0ACC0MTK9_RHOML|nr:hypothetical protein RHMOL_Rhmol08G0253000 [Rhododendron molle]